MDDTIVALSVNDRDRMSLAGLMLGSLIETNIATSRGAARAKKLGGNLGVIAGKMKITIRFERGPITVVRGLDPQLKSVVHGSLSGLLNVALGRGLLRPLLSGDISFRGNPFFLLRILPLIQAAASESTP